MNEEQIVDIRARLEAITPGTWEVHDLLGDVYVMSEGLRCSVCECAEPADAQFIAHAPAAIDALLARVEELESALSFYAKHDTYATSLQQGYSINHAPIGRDLGSMARIALDDRKATE